VLRKEEDETAEKIRKEQERLAQATRVVKNLEKRQKEEEEKKQELQKKMQAQQLAQKMASAASTSSSTSSQDSDRPNKKPKLQSSTPTSTGTTPTNETTKKIGQMASRIFFGTQLTILCPICQQKSLDHLSCGSHMAHIIPQSKGGPYEVRMLI